MKFKFFLPVVVCSFALASCSSTDNKVSNAEKAQTRTEVQSVARTESANNDAYYTVLEFNKGTPRLSEESKRSLKAFVEAARAEGKEIDDIRILAWADKEYPAKGAKLSDRDVQIASERSKAIEKYLKEDLSTDGDYATYNMAKRPNKVNEFFRGDDYKTKRIFEKPGSAPAGTQMSSFVKSKSSKALIMVDYSDTDLE